ncbi:MAG TPA: Hpt domain-containing protein [Solimonas sp.]|nr:Hpt domain-containing protein [Solimonas sp.]
MNADPRPQLVNGLHWVRGELEQSVSRARALIEQHAENGGDALPLQQAFVELHQVRGTSAMIQCYGAAALAEEMQASLQDLLQNKVRETEPLHSALLGGTVQLHDYFQALSEGAEDCALVLHPAINELRLARGQPVLTEAELFVAQMQGLNVSLPLPQGQDGVLADAQAQARKLLPHYQSSLLTWLRNPADPTGLARIGKIAEAIAQNAQRGAVHQLWRVAAAAVEALLTHALEDSLELKRLFGRAGAQLKLLADHGEDAASANAGDLSLQMLFFVGRSRGDGTRVRALRNAFNLAAYLPSAAQVEENRRKIHGPSTSLLAKVADEIRNDFAKIKDSIDLAVRTGGAGVDFTKTCADLKRISDTLGALGLNQLRQVVANQGEFLASAGADRSSAPWMDLATSILRVENSLESALFGQLRKPRDMDRPAELRDETPAERDVVEGAAALLRESLVNLARVKANVDLFLRDGQKDSLPETLQLLDEIASGFEMLGNARAAGLQRQLRSFVAGPGFLSLGDSRERAERFADTLACAEYYVEAARDHLPSAEAILDDYTHFLEQLAGTGDGTADAGAMSPDTLATPFASLAAEAAASAPAAPPGAAPAAPLVDELDPEIRDIFLEEAGEVRQTLDSTLPSWTRDPQSRDALTTIRRAFHTLKGSGRTVGASEIGEFGWSVEHVLNKCLDGSIAISAAVVAAVVESVSLLPGLIEAFRDHRPADASVAALRARLDDLAAGRDPAAAGPDNEMAEIFREDAREKLALVGDWLGQRDRSLSRQPIDPEIVRAYHTLRGAARLVGAPAIGDCAGAVETYLNALQEADWPLDGAGLQLLDDATAQLKEWTEQVGTAAAQAQDARLWLQRIQALQAHVPDQTSLLSAADRELAEIFAGEAFDLVQKLEEILRGWIQSPDNLRAPQDMKVVCHTLKGAALMSECRAIGNAAHALHLRLDELAGETIIPDAAAFGTLERICEAFYQQLDAYREGRLRGEGEVVVAQIEALVWTGGQAPPPRVIVPAPVAAEPVPAALPEVAQAAPAEELLSIEMPPVAEDEPVLAFPEEDAPIELSGFGEAPPALAPEAASAEAITPELLEAEAAIEMPPVSMGDEPLDPELLQIFLGEGEELLEALDQSTSALERDPANAQAGNELKRVLHTLKGSARVAGLPMLGDVAHAMETLLESVEARMLPLDGRFFARFHNAVDGLDLALDDLRRGVIPDVGPLLEELELSQPVVVTPPDGAPAAMPKAPQRTATKVQVDEELVGVFTAEAVELMEQLESALTQWQARPAELAAARDMQRALHTYKGGARMAGLFAMGDAAHDLETVIHRLETAGGAGSAAMLGPVAEATAGLRALTDLLERGDYAPLVQAAKPGAAAEPEPEAGTDSQAAAAAAPAESIAGFTVDEPAAALSGLWDPELFWRPDEDSESLVAMRRETARVPVEALDTMLNEAGEISIFRSRLEEHNSAVQNQLAEMAQAIQRTREQLRQLDLETEAQISARGLTQSEGADRYAGEFDPLEMDRYTRMQELSRALNESVGDLSGVHAAIDELASEAVTILLQQGRVNTEVQQGLMRTLMVPFSRQAARLQRVVQQTALENGKRAEVEFAGIEAEMDRNVLERMTAPLEHLLRNAVVHGLETPEVRERNGKPPTGKVTVRLWREGSQLFMELRDDGRGLDFQAIRETAVKRGLMPAGAQVSDEQAAQFIFMPGFSTAKVLTQDAGRGVGMDVVAAEVKQLGGTLELDSELGKGARFLIRLPLTLAMTQALLIGVGHELYALPLSSIEGLARIPREQLDALYAEDGPTFPYGGHDYRTLYLGELIGTPRDPSIEAKMVNAILVRLPEGLGAGERRFAVVVDSLLGNREIVSKAVGPQISAIPGVTGATILADGRAVLVLDVAALTHDRARRVLRTLAVGEAAAGGGISQLPLVMVVDDSTTIRRVTERLLLKNNYRVATAKDGLDAMAQLQTEQPVAILLDIEMPRADGFEVAAFVRNTTRISRTPIIMITSRSGEKHRERARTLGVNRYLIKPYQEDQLLEELRNVLAETAA